MLIILSADGEISVLWGWFSAPVVHNAMTPYTGGSAEQKVEGTHEVML